MRLATGHPVSVPMKVRNTHSRHHVQAFRPLAHRHLWTGGAGSSPARRARVAPASSASPKSGNHDEAVQGSFPDHFDPSWGEEPRIPPNPAGGSRGTPEDPLPVFKTPPQHTFSTPPVRPAHIPPGVPGRRRALRLVSGIVRLSPKDALLLRYLSLDFVLTPPLQP